MDPIEALGSIKQIDDGTTTAQLADTLAAHRSAILQVAGNAARVAERADLMMAETAALLQKQRDTTRSEWVPGGTAQMLDARYLRDDGSVQWSTRTEAIVMPDGTVEHVSAPGLLDAPHTVTPEHETLRKAFSRYALAYHLRKLQGVSVQPIVARQWRAMLEAAKALPGRTGDAVRRALTDPAEFKRVVSGASGSGGEMIGVPTTSAIIRPTDLVRAVPGLIRQQAVSVPSFKLPIRAGRGLARKRGATSNDPSRYTTANFTTSDRTITVVDRQITALLDPLWLQDAVSTIGDPMGEVMDWLSRADIDALELAFLHGDTAGTHQDTLSTWTMNGLFTAGDVDGTDSPAKFWIGFRARAADDSKTASAGGTLSLAELFAAQEALGPNGADAVHITGLHAMYTQIMVLAEVVTIDLFGPRASVVAGQVASVGGCPIVISHMMGNEFDTTSGLYTGSNLGAEIVTVSPSAYTHFTLDAGPSGDFDELRQERGAQYVGMVRRSVLASVIPAAENPAFVTYNL